MQSFANSPERTALYRKIEVARKQLTHMGDEQFRQMLEDRYAVRSRTHMSVGQLINLVKHCASLGAVFTARKGIPAKQDGYLNPQLKKIEALLAEKGYVERTELPWAYAHAICTRLNGGIKLNLRQADANMLNGVIAALIADAKRKGRYYEEYGVEYPEDPEIIATYGGRCRNG